MKLNEIIRDANYDGDNEYRVTYTTNRGRDENTRKILAKSKKNAVLFVLKTLGNPIKIDGQDIDHTKLDEL